MDGGREVGKEGGGGKGTEKRCTHREQAGGMRGKISGGR